MRLPSLSIVTLSYNQGRYLAECLDSVASQKASGVQYIVVDPGSSDGSRELLAQRRCDVDVMLLEPDLGPADGLNKAFARTEANVLGYINADDRYAPGALEFVRRFFAERPEIDVLCGAIRMIDARGRAALRARTSDRFDLRRYAAGVCTVCQQATFFRRSAFLRTGGFRIDNRVAWDGELLVDLALCGARFATVGRVLGEFRIYGEQITGSANYAHRLAEYRAHLESRLAERGVAVVPPARRRLMRLAYKANLARHTGYLVARWR